jgi:predicted transcriptional regulator
MFSAVLNISSHMLTSIIPHAHGVQCLKSFKLEIFMEYNSEIPVFNGNNHEDASMSVYIKKQYVDYFPPNQMGIKYLVMSTVLS